MQNSTSKIKKDEIQKLKHKVENRNSIILMLEAALFFMGIALFRSM